MPNVLKNFLYLDEVALQSYLSQLEDGVRQKRSAASNDGRDLGAALRGGPLQANASSSSGSSGSTEYADTPEAQLERLLLLRGEAADELDWIEAVQPDVDLPAARIGTFVELECEVHVPEVLRALSDGSELSDLIGTLKGMSSFLRAVGEEPEDMPSDDQLAALQQVPASVKTALVMKGEPDSDVWTVAGTLRAPSVRQDVAGAARVIGKVSAVVPEGRFRPLFEAQGMGLMNRQQRREMEKNGPADPDDDTWLKGPALILDVLAVYR